VSLSDPFRMAGEAASIMALVTRRQARVVGGRVELGEFVIAVDDDGADQPDAVGRGPETWAPAASCRPTGVETQRIDGRAEVTTRPTPPPRNVTVTKYGRIQRRRLAPFWLPNRYLRSLCRIVGRRPLDADDRGTEVRGDAAHADETNRHPIQTHPRAGSDARVKGRGWCRGQECSSPGRSPSIQVDSIYYPNTGVPPQCQFLP